ncbi:MAG: 1-deoxy-D-xylulose-5-phosphate synthase, partial [Muribaculaceae bacterium]|nr:1-deoxy-D-xylulose-5-phosphate synthase [Muribaculaceae bacterium]
MKDIDLSTIHSPADIKGMSVDELRALAAEMRSALMKRLSTRGGHVGPNLGMVEATIALHYVFDAPTDKIVYDVSHQAYPHKMLTGRMQAYTDPEHYGDVTGFTDPEESPDYDLFSIGHTSTALALASGLAKARDLAGERENVIAVVGDGSLGGGEALEGLNYGSTLGSNFIVVINDNDMSIAENHGGLYADLRLLRHSNGTAEPNIFRAMGYSYRYVHYGNDLNSLIETFRAVKDIDHPVVVHINTMKGMGLAVAEADKESFHYTGPFDLKTGAPLSQPAADAAPATYTEIFADHMLSSMQTNPKLCVLNAGTPGAIGFTPAKRREAGRRFIDVGIAEQMCTGMAAGMAKGGMRPVMGVVATFFQRAYDQVSQDVAINNMPAVFNVFFGSVYGMTDQTHLG